MAMVNLLTFLPITCLLVWKKRQELSSVGLYEGDLKIMSVCWVRDAFSAIEFCQCIFTSHELVARNSAKIISK